MSQQINLYEKRLRPRHDLVTACNLGVCVLLALLVMVPWAVWSGISASRSAEAAALARKELSEEQEKLVTLTRELSQRQVSPALAGQLERVRDMLATRTEVLQILDSGRLGNASGFSAFMAGFARQAQADLWLTGFRIAAGGDDIEIRGRMLNPSRLPVYVQHLSSEPVFQGRRFAALDMQDVDPDEQAKTSPAMTKSEATERSGEAQRLPRYVEFTLRSDRAMADAKPGREGRE